MYRLNLVTAPSIEPVTLAQAKSFMKVDGTGDDDLITSLIIAARQAAEEFTGRAFIRQAWEMKLDSFYFPMRNTWWDGVREMPISELWAKKEIEIPKANLISVVHIKVYANDDTATTLDASTYRVLTYSGAFAGKGRVAFKDSGLPILPGREQDGVEIHFYCGYGTLATDVPAAIKQAILVDVASMYENRGSCDNAGCGEAAKKLLQPFRFMRV